MFFKKGNVSQLGADSSDINRTRRTLQGQGRQL